MSFLKYQGCKKSGIDWISEVPSHWRIQSLKRHARLLTEKTDRRDHPVALENIEGWTGRFLPTDTEFEGEGVAFDDGDVLFGKLRPYLAKTLVADLSGEAVGDFLVIRPTVAVMPHFLGYQLRSREVISLIDGSTFGSKMPRASWDFVGAMRLTLPPVDEQQKIVTFLDHETAKIDALVADQQRLIELLQEKRHAVISHAVTKGLDPAVPMKDSGVDWIGQIPDHWTVKPLRHCVDYQEGPGIMADDFHEVGIPLLRISGVQSHLAKLEGCNFLDPNKVMKRWNHFRLAKGDLLISASASMGTVCEVGDEAEGAVAYTGIIRLRGIDKQMAKDFVRHMVVSMPFLTQIDLLKAGATIQHYGPTHLSQMFALQPPLAEQAVIAAFIDRELKSIDSFCEEADAAKVLLQERRTALISAAVTGKIDVRNWPVKELQEVSA